MTLAEKYALIDPTSKPIEDMRQKGRNFFSRLSFSSNKQNICLITRSKSENLFKTLVDDTSILHCRSSKSENDGVS